MAAAMVMKTMAIIGALLVASVPYADAGCDFSSSCDDIAYDSGYLTATCLGWQGYHLQSKIYLNNAVANKDGTLECPRYFGGFLSSCTDISVSGSSLTASCTNYVGDSVVSTVNLDSCIKNDNAGLFWCGTYSTSAATV